MKSKFIKRMNQIDESTMYQPVRKMEVVHFDLATLIKDSPLIGALQLGEKCLIKSWDVVNDDLVLTLSQGDVEVVGEDKEFWDSVNELKKGVNDEA